MNFRPDTIFVYSKIKDNQITKKILSNFSGVKVEYIPNQLSQTIRKMEKKFEMIKSKNKSAECVNIAKKILVIGTSSRSQFVEKFVNKLDCICPSFYCITPMNNGCYYSCMYCFLQITYRGVHPYIKINVNINDLKESILNIAKKEIEKNPNRKINFNCGEKLDSLSFDKYTNFTKELLPFFAERKELTNSTLLLLTKSTCIDNLIKLAKNNPKITKRTILSWSINAEEYAKKYEIYTPLPSERLKSAKKCQDLGYTIRLRIDPMLFLPHWKKHYKNLVKEIFEKNKLKPEVITLGSMRFETGLDSLAKARFKDTDLFNYDFIVEGKDKHRYRVEDRAKLYKFMNYTINMISKENNIRTPKIGLCKEKREVWSLVDLDLKNGHCNCVGNWNEKRRRLKWNGKMYPMD